MSLSDMVATGELKDHSEIPAELNARIAYRYSVLGLKPVSAKLVVFASATSISCHEVDVLYRRILNPASLLKLICQVKLIWLDKTVFAVREASAAEEQKISISEKSRPFNAFVLMCYLQLPILLFYMSIPCIKY